MKNTFYEYYKPSTAELSAIWDECIFAIDANVILNFYKYSSTTASQLMKVIEKLSDRVWIPHQAALEFQRNRLNVISSQNEAFLTLKKDLEDLKLKNITTFKKFSKHPTLNSKGYIEKIENFYNEINNELNKDSDSHPNFLDNDPLFEKISHLFNEKVGSPLNEQSLKELEKEGAERYKQKNPSRI